jgi:large subunit ribosomal protein L5
MKPRLYTKYIEEVRPALTQKRGYNNVHQVPRIEKIVINMGVSASLEKGALEDAVKEMQMITGRKAVVNISRKSIANFKLRKGQSVGCKVTLRREVMYEFFDRLVTAVRRPRNLFPRHPRPDDLPGDRTRQDQAAAGHGHHHRDLRPDQ